MTEHATLADGPVVRRQRRAARNGPDRVVVGLLSLTAFLIVLALMVGQLRASVTVQPHRAMLVRKIYRTTVVESIVTGAGRDARSVSQSTSGASATSAGSSAPVTRTS